MKDFRPRLKGQKKEMYNRFAVVQRFERLRHRDGSATFRAWNSKLANNMQKFGFCPRSANCQQRFWFFDVVRISSTVHVVVRTRWHVRQTIFWRTSSDSKFESNGKRSSHGDVAFGHVAWWAPFKWLFEWLLDNRSCSCVGQCGQHKSIAGRKRTLGSFAARDERGRLRIQ